ncbi:MAG: hypothetical protein Unbinned5350contig1001_28 [Prokaryotic dsDNA virus sp.]|nr:MAG: hypothetical protein Unbinned5350contig1001_28 [Prokaryotic dsDNA virus sp.]|tara:strand:- start:18957 stop:19328 length:372 start_codon:yes stop_codon:yes gene_type:complete
MEVKVIHEMDKGDFTEERGTEKIQMKRGIEIEGKNRSNLMVTLSLNWKKGLYSITPQWNSGQITGDDIIDTATLRAMNQLMFSARNRGRAWQMDWNDKNPVDPAQEEIFPKDEDEDLQEGFGE